MPAKLIEGDLLESDVKYIVHQCNCVSISSSGIANAIFTKFPYSDIYTSRQVTEHHDTPGTIIIQGNGKNLRYVINLMGQYFPGKSKSTNVDMDCEANRKEWFFQGLKAISKIEKLESIAFPDHIGCNLAGGNWDEYLKLINKFADHVMETQQAETYIVKLPI